MVECGSHPNRKIQGVNSGEEKSSAMQLPAALDSLDRIVPAKEREPAVFLDYDGTLTPIVDNPDKANLSASMHATLQHLATLCEVAIISGRDLQDVRERVGVDNIWYAGSHGFEIAGPRGEHTEYQEGLDYLPALDAAEQRLRAALVDISGCLVERKKFSIAIHYRQVAQDEVESVRRIVDRIHASHSELRLMQGKKIFELQPDIEWNKGKAIHWLISELALKKRCFTLIYIGDDVTDEDAFHALGAEGSGILVAGEDQQTFARYRLADPAEVEIFLNRLCNKLEKSS